MTAHVIYGWQRPFFSSLSKCCYFRPEITMVTVIIRQDLCRKYKNVLHRRIVAVAPAAQQATFSNLLRNQRKNNEVSWLLTCIPMALLSWIFPSFANGSRHISFSVFAAYSAFFIVKNLKSILRLNKTLIMFYSSIKRFSIKVKTQFNKVKED